MLNNVGDIITEVLVRNNRSTTDSFITDAMLQDWTRDAHVWAASYHKWVFTEGRQSTTYTGAEEWSFEGYKADSFRIVQVGGKRLQKLNFEDYQIFREETPGADDRVYSDFGRTVFINPNADVSGSLTVYGQYQPSLDSTDLAATTIFSGYDEEGNEALVEKITGYLKRREHLPDEADLHDQRAALKLEEIWKRTQDEQALYQTHPTRGGMWKRFDVLKGRQSDEIRNEDQF
jgi:hypothetical protein